MLPLDFFEEFEMDLLELEMIVQKELVCFEEDSPSFAKSRGSFLVRAFVQ